MPTTTQTTTLPDTLNSALQYILSEGMNVYQNTPYEAYQYPRVAPLSQYQTQAFQGVQNAQGNWQPANSQAQSMAQQVFGSAGGMANPSFERVSSPLIASQVVGAAQFPQADISRYMNPYESLVTGAAVRNLEDAAARQQANADARFAKSGAFGGSRQGLYDANLSTQVARQAGELTNQSRAQNYTNAQGVWQNDANRLLQADLGTAQMGLQAAGANQQSMLRAALANQSSDLDAQRLGLSALGQQLGAAQLLGNLGNSASTNAYRDVEALLGIGSLDRSLAQKNADIAYSDWQEQQNYPWTQLGKLSSVVNGSPLSRSGTQTTNTPDPNMWTQLLGGATSIAGLLKNTGAFGQDGWLTGGGTGSNVGSGLLTNSGTDSFGITGGGDLASDDMFGGGDWFSDSGLMDYDYWGYGV